MQISVTVHLASGADAVFSWIRDTFRIDPMDSCTAAAGKCTEAINAAPTLPAHLRS